MKRILIIVLCLTSLVPSMLANEKEDSDSLSYYVEKFKTSYLSQNYDEAFNYINDILRIYKDISYDLSQDLSQDTIYAELERWRGRLCNEIEKYEIAIDAYTITLSIYKEIYGESHSKCANILSNLASCYSQKGNNQEALKLAEESYKIDKKTISTSNPNYLIGLDNLVGYCRNLKDYKKAILYATEAVEIKKNILKESDSIIANELNDLAIDYYRINEFPETIKLLSEAIDILNHTHNTDNLGYATILTNLADAYSQIGDYKNAIHFASEAVEIKKNLIDKDSTSYALSLSDLANYYSYIGNYQVAFQLGYEALNIIENSLNPNYLQIATSLNNLADYHSHIGNFNDAISLETEAINTMIAGGIPDTTRYAQQLNNLANYYFYSGNYLEAVRFGTEAMEIKKRYLNSNPLDYAMSLNNLACFYAFFKEYPKATQYAVEALDLYKNILGEVHPAYAKSLINLSTIFFANGNRKEAIKTAENALTIFKRTLGIKHPDYELSLLNYICFNAMEGNFCEAILLIRDNLLLIRNHIISEFSWLTAYERFMYWNQAQYSDTFNTLVPYVVINSRMPDAASMLYDNTALFAKGLLLSTELEMAKIIQESGDAEVLQMYSQLRQYRQILNAQYLKPISERQINCDSLEKVSMEVERQLVSRVKEFGDYTRNLSITWQDVQSKLNDNDIAIEFLSYFDIDGGTTYAALTLCKGDTMPMLTPLFAESQLNTASSIQETYQAPITDALVWSPLSSRLEGKTRVYFSASGMLHNIGIEYLPSMEGKECYRLSSTRELAIERSGTPSNGAVVYGGIQYDSDVSQMGMPRKDGSFLAHRGFNPDSVTVRGNWDYLTWSLDEANEVDSILEIKNVDVKKVTGLDATETSFKDLSGQRKRILHIATHGFYYNDSTAHRYNERERLGFLQMDNDRPRYVEDKAMTRSGLLFAGAQNTFNGVKIPDGVDDGVLTAQEVAQLDLRGLDLLVLSACQTGLGEITGDGVFGLQRGFKKAGAKSILMSLWNVNDNATHLLMTEFYRGWTSGLTKYAALRQAQSVVKEKYPDPRHWAAFILLDALD